MTKTSSTRDRLFCLSLAVCLAGMIGGCVLEDAELGLLAQAAGGTGDSCLPTNGCPTNAHIGNDAVGYIKLDGSADPGRFGIKTNGNFFNIVNGELFRNGVALVQYDTFEVYKGTRIYTVEILNKEAVLDFTVAQGDVISYRLAFWNNGNPEDPIDVCEELAGATENYKALLIKGESYRTNDSVVDITGGTMSNAFNIACINGALAKMRRFALDPAAGTSTARDRQTALWMTTASYCGDAYPFTALGTKLGWHKLDNTVYAVPTGARIEALWDEHGALCVSRPRLSDGTEENDDEILDLVEEQCATSDSTFTEMQSCDDEDFSDPTEWPTKAKWVTYWVP